MTSICSSYPQHFQLTNGNIMLLHQQQQQLQQQQLQQLQQQQQQHHHQLIAPKQPLGNSQMQNMQNGSGNLGPILAKKKYSNNYTSLPYGGASEAMPSVARRNARERNRVKQVNNGFVNLRQHLPQSVINTLSNGGRGASKKLSKVDTLRIAVEYIRGLQDMLGDGQSDGLSSVCRQLYATATDESSNDGSYNDYNDSLDSPPTAGAAIQTGNLKGAQYSYHSASPAHSYSDASDLSASYVKQELTEQDVEQQQQQQQFKFESFDSFSDEQPDDEELLDYISSWQEQ